MGNVDALLWDSFKKGDWEAYTSLYNAYFKLLNNYGYKFTRDVYLIEDSVHDLFIRLWKNKSNLGDPASVKNYLYKAFRNVIFRKMQNQPGFVELDGDYPFSFELSFDHSLIAAETEAELRNRIKSVIDTLPGRQQEIVHLRFYEGFSYNEIADIMEISINSAYKLLYKAINNLQTILKVSKLSVIMALTILYKSTGVANY